MFEINSVICDPVALNFEFICTKYFLFVTGYFVRPKFSLWMTKTFLSLASINVHLIFRESFIVLFEDFLSHLRYLKAFMVFDISKA